MQNEVSERRKRSYLVAGAVAVAVALWLILDSLGVPVPSLRRFWPIFPLLGGLASALDYFVGSKRPGSMGRGVAGVCMALLFFSFTYAWLPWQQVKDWYPALPLIAGVGLFATWVAGRRTPGFLISGVVGMALGLTGFIFRFERLRALLPPPALIWGVLVLVLGGYLLWRAFGGRRGSDGA